MKPVLGAKINGSPENLSIGTFSFEVAILTFNFLSKTETNVSSVLS